MNIFYYIYTLFKDFMETIHPQLKDDYEHVIEDVVEDVE